MASYSQIIFGDDGSVIVSDHTPSSWTFSTISAPYDWTHPVSDNRKFGFSRNSDGSYTFYTKGVDRFTKDWFSENISTMINLGDTFSDADNLWKSFQKGIKEYVNAHGGNASINNPKTIRPDWDKIQKVLDPNDPTGVSSLKECN